jgi:uncharacterized membrane protein
MTDVLITNDAIVLGILLSILAIVFKTSSSESKGWKKFYTFVPPLLMCYFLPSVLTTIGVYSPDESKLYFVASRYLLPACLVFLTLSIDLKGILNLGPKAIIMFLAGTFGIILGGPLAIFSVGLLFPDLFMLDGEPIWRGMTTIAGSWIGGGANQTAMYEMYKPSDALFSAMIAVDIIVANIWLAFLLYGSGMSTKIDKWLKSDVSAIEKLKEKTEAYRNQIAVIPTLNQTIFILAIGFGVTAIAHLGADYFAPLMDKYKGDYEIINNFNLNSGFFWLIVISTTIGLALSFTPARKLEGAGASRFGSLFIYVLVATIGMKMDITAVANSPGFFLIGIVWMLFHVAVLLITAKIIKAPFFFVAVGSQANVGGAASAPIVASAFHPSLATVGVLMAVVGYAAGTYGAIICARLMEIVFGWAI